MSEENHYLDNYAVLVTREDSVRYGEMARVARLPTEESRIYEVEFADEGRGSLLEEECVLYARYDLQNRFSSRCLCQGRNLVKLRDDYCKMNDGCPETFSRNYAKLFIRSK